MVSCLPKQSQGNTHEQTRRADRVPVYLGANIIACSEGSIDITWIDADVTDYDLPSLHYDVWHNRAVFHFLTAASDRHNYVDMARKSLKLGGHLIMATFAVDEPAQCSGLQVMRWSPNILLHEFGEGFDLVDSRNETRDASFWTQQKFIYCHCQKRLN